VSIPVTYEPVGVSSYQSKVGVVAKHTSVFECVAARLHQLGYDAHPLDLDAIVSADEYAYILVETDEPPQTLSPKLRYFTTRFPCENNLLSLCDLDSQWQRFINEGAKRSHIKPASANNDLQLTHEVKTALHVIEHLLADAPNKDAYHDMLDANVQKIKAAVEHYIEPELSHSSLCVPVFESSIRALQGSISNLDDVTLHSDIASNLPYRVDIPQVLFSSICTTLVSALLQQARKGNIHVQLHPLESEDGQCLSLVIKHRHAEFLAGGNAFYKAWHSVSANEQTQTIRSLAERLKAQVMVEQHKSNYAKITCLIPYHEVTQAQEVKDPLLICVVGGDDDTKQALLNRLRFCQYQTLEWYDDREVLLNSDMLDNFYAVLDLCAEPVDQVKTEVNWYHIASLYDPHQELHSHNITELLEHRQEEQHITRAMRCLMIDDQHDNLLLFSSMLKNTQIEVVTLSSAEEAIEQGIDDYDVIFCDINLDGMSGLEFTSYVRNTLASEVPIILCSAAVDHLKSDVFAMPNIQSLPKPFSKGQVLDMLKLH
jgi:CheY-like chemotaxis protein/uncharacterized protein GlcG (DUF336 family)